MISANSPLQDAARLYHLGLHTRELKCYHVTISDTRGCHLELISISEVVCHPFNLSWFCLYM